MEQETIRFEQRDNDVFVYGYPELKDRKGILAGDGMAFFFGEGWRNYELHVANTLTGKIRKLSTTDGELLVNDDDIDYDEIVKLCAFSPRSLLFSPCSPLHIHTDARINTDHTGHPCCRRALGCCIQMDDILPIAMDLGWRTMTKKKYTQSLILIWSL